VNNPAGTAIPTSRSSRIAICQQPKAERSPTLIDELKQLSAHEYVPATSVAMIYAGLSEKNLAFPWLDKAYEQRAFQLQWIKIEPRWDGLRSDLRCQG
jgi:hypothetical protein